MRTNVAAGDACLSLIPKVVLNEIDHHLDLSFAQDAAEGHHPVAAIRDVIIYLLVRLILMLAVTDVWNDAAVVECLAFALGAVTNRTILTKERGGVGAAVRDRISSRVLRSASDCDPDE